MRKVPERPVFIDETAVRTGLTRLRGRSPKGERLTGSAPFGHWQTQTFIAGLTCEGLIAPWVIPGAMDRAAFDTWTETQLAPCLAPGTAVILDNLSVHRSPRAAEVLEDHRCWLLPLPACSPDLNPIEMAFAKLKAHLRRIGARTFDAIIAALGDICQLFTPHECFAYLAHAGYVADQTQTALACAVHRVEDAETGVLEPEMESLVGSGGAIGRHDCAEDRQHVRTRAMAEAGRAGDESAHGMRDEDRAGALRADRAGPPC